MKHIITIIALLSSLAVFGQDISRQLEDDALQALDNICGDTWCEGDFDFSFQSLECDLSKQTCELSFSYIEWGETSGDEWEIVKEIPAKCTLEGITSASMLESRNYGMPQDDLYWKVGDCIDENYPEY